ncbi:MAG: glutathione S-transferase [Alphaproteobacteria bacterium]
MPAAFTLHGHRESGNAYKVALTLKLAGARFDYRHVDLFSGATRTPEFWATNPMGEIPVLIHDGATLVQTTAILLHLADHFHRFGGRDETERRRVFEWLCFETGRPSNGVSLARFARKFQKADPVVIGYLQARGRAGLDTLERCLTARFLVGDAPTVADFGASAYLMLADEAGLDIADWPRVAAWLDRIRALPGYVPQYDLLPDRDRDGV